MKHNVSFPEMISSLQLNYLRNDYAKNNNFWYVIDKLDNVELQKWLNRLSHRRILPDNDWAVLCSILHQIKYLHGNWSQRQKRACAMMLIKSWDEISLEYEY